MPQQHLLNYLRAHRKRLGLSQVDVAFLLGVRGGSKVSRYEHFRRIPTLETALALEYILHTQVHDLFAGLAEEAERAARRRAQYLLRRLAHDRDGRKLTALRSLTEPQPPDDLTIEPLDFS